MQLSYPQFTKQRLLRNPMSNVSGLQGIIGASWRRHIMSCVPCATIVPSSWLIQRRKGNFWWWEWMDTVTGFGGVWNDAVWLMFINILHLIRISTYNLYIYIYISIFDLYIVSVYLSFFMIQYDIIYIIKHPSDGNFTCRFTIPDAQSLFYEHIYNLDQFGKSLSQMLNVWHIFLHLGSWVW